jgi:CRP-like cAMP-binding protein
MLKQPIPISDFLTNLPLFEDMDESVIGRLAAGMTALDASKGTVFLRRGDLCTGLHVVVYGLVKLSLQAPQGDEKVVDLLGRGDTFGEAPMFLDQPFRVTAECLTDSKLLHLSKAVVVSEVDCNPVFARRIISRLSRKFSQLILDLEGCTLRTGTQRVVGYLLNRMADHKVPGTPAITFPAQKSIIASHLNLTHEHFSRILHDLTAAGMIEVHGPVVRILDPAELRSRVS